MAGLSKMKRRATTSALDDLRSDWTTIEPPTTLPPPTPTNIIERLPGELQNKIFDRLTYTEAICLSVTSKHFHQVVKPHMWTKAEKEESLHAAEKWQRYNKAYLDFRFSRYKPRNVVTLNDGYACFHCYKILDKSQFSRNQTERDGAKGSGVYSYVGHFRCCIECAIKEGKYRAGTFFKVVTSQSMNLDGGCTSTTKSLKIMFFCPACEEAHEFIDVGYPEVCNNCEKAQFEFYDSEDAFKALIERKKGLMALECDGCKSVTEFRRREKDTRCSGCDSYICEKCGGAKWEEGWDDDLFCDCSAEVDDFTGFKRLFQLEGAEEGNDSDIFEEVDSGVIDLLGLDGE